MADSVFNRLAWVLFILTYMLLVFGWIETIHIKYPAPSDTFVPAVKWILVGLGSFFFLFQAITLIVYFTTRVLDSNGFYPPNPPYDANIWIFNVFLFALSLAFLVYGIFLLTRLNRGLTNRHSVGVVDSRNRARQRSTFMKARESFFLCCLLRAWFRLSSSCR